MRRYKIIIEYDGTRYCGWQKQHESPTVEAAIEEGLSRILRREVDIYGQGRTDSGVHAEAQTAHFDFPEKLDKDELLFALMGVLPRDIAVWDLEEVAPDFHARFDATARQYRYQIVRRRRPLWKKQSAMILGELNLAVMQACASRLTGEHDFSAFTRPDRQDRAVCEVSLSEFVSEDHLLCYRIRANRFVQHMVRRLVGTMIEVGTGKKSEDEFRRMLSGEDTTLSAHGAAARGLILEKVFYE